MQARLAEMEEEKKQLASGEAAGSASGTPKPEGDEAAGDDDDAAAVDARSIYIGNVSASLRWSGQRTTNRCLHSGSTAI